MPCRKKSFKKKNRRKVRGTSGRLFLLFLMFCLVTNMSLVNQDGNIVLGLTESYESYDFEGTTATKQVKTIDVGNDFFYSWNESEGSFVDTTVAESGSKSYRVDDTTPGAAGYARFNSSLGEDVYIINISFWIYFPDTGTNDANAGTFELRDYSNVKLLDFGFRTDDLSTLEYGYIDHNTVWQNIGHRLKQDVWHQVFFNFVSNDDATIGVLDSDGVTNETTGIQPINVVDSPQWDHFRFIASSHLFNDELFYVDNFNVTVVDFPLWWPGVSGDINISVFNESNTSQAVTNWDVYVKTTGGALLYSLVGQSNPVVIETKDIGTGERVFEIYNDSYFERYYIVDIVSQANHTLTAYLPPVSEAFLYYIKVQDSIESPLYQVYIQLSRNFNGTVSDIAQGYTDIFGLYPVYLLGGQQYGINLSKTGYDDFTGTFVTDPNSYGYNNPIIFELGYTSFNESVISANDLHFNATINDAGTIQVWYEDYYSNTTDTNITIYEYYNGTYTYNYSEERTGDNSFTFTDAGYNTSMMHYIILHVNHTDLDPNHQILYILLHPLTSGQADESVIEKYWTDVFGNWDLGWTKTLLVFLPCILFLIVFGPNHVGLGILGSSLYMGFATVMIDFGASATAMFLFISSMVAVTGVVMIIAKKGKAAI